MKRIEDMTISEMVDVVKDEKNPGTLNDLRLRCMQIWDKSFDRPSVRPSVTRDDLLQKYEVLVARLRELGSHVRTASGIDSALMRKNMLGVDVAALPEIVVVSGAVVITGAQAVDPASAELVNLSVDERCAGADVSIQEISKAVAAQTGKSVGAQIVYDSTDAPESIIPLFDLVLVPRPTTQRLVKGENWIEKEATGWTTIQKPYPNEHAARQNEPGKYVKMRRQNNKFAPGIDVIWGVTEAGKTEIQAIRFKADKYTPEQARKWLEEHGYKTTVEEATKKSAIGFRVVKVKSEDQHIVAGIVYEADTEDSQGDYTTADEITKMMYAYMEKCQTFKEMHEGTGKSVTILESFQADADTKKFGQTIKKGAWFITVRVNDPDIWEKVKSGEYTGFSMGGKAETQEG